MTEMIQDIPKLYTALAEWCSCLIIILMLPKRFSRQRTAAILAIAAVVLGIVQYFIGIVPLYLWIPGMMLALLVMYFTIWGSCDISMRTGLFLLMIAFLTAEFMASVEWQIYYYVNQIGIESKAIEILLLCFFYTLICFVEYKNQVKSIADAKKLILKNRDLVSSILIAFGAFSISNISYVNQNTPFSGVMPTQIFYIRTLVDLAGLVMLLAFLDHCRESVIKSEYDAIQVAMNRQHEIYQQSKLAMEVVNRKYHDIKHQISVIRMEQDAQKKEEYLKELESGLEIFASLYQTGSKVLDIILTEKQRFCNQHNIQFVVVADGSKISFINDMDLASMLGNALDNAIESAEHVLSCDKRIVKTNIFVQNNFLMIKVDNYFEGAVQIKDGSFVTTKKDKDNHGFGIRSIEYLAERYNGAVSVSTENNWFSIKILIPMKETE